MNDPLAGDATEPARVQRSGLAGLHDRFMRPRYNLPAERRELYGVTFYTCLVGLLAYLSYIPLFWALDAQVIALANVVVIGVFVVAGFVLVRGHVFAGMATASSAVAGHAWLTATTLGGDGAFQLHVILALELGLIFTYVPLRVRLMYASVFTLAYLGLVYTLATTSPTAPLAEGPAHAFELLNSAVFAGVTVLIATIYAWSVRSNRLAREHVVADLAERNETLHHAQVELARARDVAQEASKAKSMFLANMSHELRTPLNAIIGYSEIIEEDAQEEGNAELVDEVGRITGAGRHLLALINDILDLAKIEAGHMTCERVAFSLQDLATEVVDTIRTLAQAKNNRLSLNIEKDLDNLESDPTKVRQILFNLLANACKFTNDGKVTLAIAAESRDGLPGVRIGVSDTGIGIPPDKIEHIFGEFSQADDSTTRRFGGTGLGLTITHRFSEMLGGTIEVRSEEGTGSEFEVWLPATLPRENTLG